MGLAEDGFVAAVAATSRAAFFTAFLDLAQRDFCAAVKTCNLVPKDGMGGNAS
jgi:hypothetical protein